MLSALGFPRPFIETADTRAFLPSNLGFSVAILYLQQFNLFRNLAAGAAIAVVNRQ